MLLLLLQTISAGIVLQPPLLTNTSQIYEAGISVGAVNVEVPLFSNSNSFYPASVNNGADTLSPSLFTNTNSFYSQNINLGAVVLASSLFSNSNSFFASTVNRGGVTLAPSLFSNSNSFYTATITNGAVSLAPSLFSNTNSFFASTVSNGGVNLILPLFTNTNSFYSQNITLGAVILTGSLFTNSNSFYTATVTKGTVNLSSSLFSNTNTFYSPVITKGTVNLSPSLFTNTNSFYSSLITKGAVSLSPSLFSNTNSFFSSTVAASSFLSVSLFSNSNSFYTPTLNITISGTATGIATSAPLTLTGKGFIGATLNIGFKPSLFDIASAVRIELATELNRIDVNISSRLAEGSYLTPPSISDISAEIDTNSIKLNNIESDLIIINEGVQKVSLLVPHSTDLISGTSVLSPSLFTNTNIFHTPVITQGFPIQGGTATGIATSAPFILVGKGFIEATLNIGLKPSVFDIASAIRSELAIELNRIDVNISSRLAGSSYTIPPSASAIRSEIDANSIKLNNIESDLIVINNGIKKASLLVPHSENL